MLLDRGYHHKLHKNIQKKEIGRAQSLPDSQHAGEHQLHVTGHLKTQLRVIGHDKSQLRVIGTLYAQLHVIGQHICRHAPARLDHLEANEKYSSELQGASKGKQKEGTGGICRVKVYFTWAIAS